MPLKLFEKTMIIRSKKIMENAFSVAVNILKWLVSVTKQKKNVLPTISLISGVVSKIIGGGVNSQFFPA